ncbi:hypothetical protein, partial [Streptomyces sp. WAC00469]|uniref:hypothetical protein n=1 Tax=Streptomyces sp. WAC00469 TaxID=2487415 RepID=UPI00163C11D3
IVTDPAFAPEIHGQEGPFTVHTRWIETEFTNDIPAFTSSPSSSSPAAPAPKPSSAPPAP